MNEWKKMFSSRPFSLYKILKVNHFRNIFSLMGLRVQLRLGTYKDIDAVNIVK